MEGGLQQRRREAEVPAGSLESGGGAYAEKEASRTPRNLNIQNPSRIGPLTATSLTATNLV